MKDHFSARRYSVKQQYTISSHETKIWGKWQHWHFFFLSCSSCYIFILIDGPPPCPSYFTMITSLEGNGWNVSPQFFLTCVHEITSSLPCVLQISLKFISYIEPSYASINRAEFWFSQLDFHSQGLLLLHCSSLQVILSHLIGTPGWFKPGEIPLKLPGCLCAMYSPTLLCCFSGLGSILFKTFANRQCRVYNKTNKQ